MSPDLVYLIGGAALLLGVVLPTALSKVALSAPIVLVVVGAGIGLLPGSSTISPVDHRALTEHLTEFCVLVALMGVGLALDRPAAAALLGDVARVGVDLAAAADRHAAGHRGDGAARLVGDGAGRPGTAVLVAAVLAPTDPVLAADVQVEGPSTDMEDASAADEIDEKDEVRFALTSEAGLNDGLAFPFVYAAIFLATLGGSPPGGCAGSAGSSSARPSSASWSAPPPGGCSPRSPSAHRGSRCGWRRPASRCSPSPRRSWPTGWPRWPAAGASWRCSPVRSRMRSAERSSEYHVLMHQVVERLERLLTLVVLLLLGVALTDGLLANLTWQGAVLGVLVIFVVRPVSALPGPRAGRATGLRQRPPARTARAARHRLLRRARCRLDLLPRLRHGPGRTSPDQRLLWSTVAFTIVLSVLVHGVAATPVMRWLEKVRRPVPVL